MTSREGARIPCLNEGMLAFNIGSNVDSHEKNTQKEETNANCMRVSVAGLGRALRIDFEEVFVKALEKYQMMQRICT